MMMTHEVIDNFLDKSEFKPLQSLLMSKSFAWHYEKKVVAVNSSIDNHNIYMYHIQYANRRHRQVQTNSQLYQPIMELMDYFHSRLDMLVYIAQSQKIYQHKQRSKVITIPINAIQYDVTNISFDALVDR